jgi:hypothetical protein
MGEGGRDGGSLVLVGCSSGVQGGKRMVPWRGRLGGPGPPTLTHRRRGVASHPKRDNAVPRRMLCPQCNGARRGRIWTRT